VKYDHQINTILYATDLGSETRQVFRYAIDMANYYKAEIVILHVVEPMQYCQGHDQYLFIRRPVRGIGKKQYERIAYRNEDTIKKIFRGRM